MGTPAARILLNVTESIKTAVEKPSIKFKRKGRKSIVTITLAFNEIADIIEDSDIDDNPIIFCDALLDKEFLSSGNAKVIFTPVGVNGASMMTVTAELPTKLPGTGSDLLKMLVAKKITDDSFGIAEKQAGDKEEKK